MNDIISIPQLYTSGASIENYLQAVNKYAVLSKTQETKLALKFRDHGDLNAAKKLVLAHLRLVVSIARNNLGYGLPFSDLIQEGNVGLMKAVRRFDPDKGVRLVSFAMHWIKAEINDYVIKNWRLVRVATTKAQRKLFFNLRRLKKSHQSLKSNEIREIADELNVRESDVRNMEKRLSDSIDSIDQNSVDDEHGYSQSPISIAANSADEPLNILEKKQTVELKKTELENALETLSERAKFVIRSRWLSEKGQNTLQDLAEQLGISAERVRQIESKAIASIKDHMIRSGFFD